jgi:chromatin segregation and condensation protein Rec8/ScpA/Scc1 (kleisin family)
VNPTNKIKKKEIILDTTWDEVYATALSVTTPSMDIVEHRVVTRPVAMEDKVDLILLTLQRLKRVEFSRLLEPFESRVHGVMTFLASLELARNRKVQLRQTRAFADLWIYRFTESDLTSVELQLNSEEE